MKGVSLALDGDGEWKADVVVCDIQGIDPMMTDSLGVLLCRSTGEAGRGAGIMAGGEVSDPLTSARKRCEHIHTFRHLGRSFKWPSFVWHEGRCEWSELAARRTLVRQRQHFLKSPGTY